jgi:hypothetical protein
MALHFGRAGPASEELEIWSASEHGFSSVISNESRTALASAVRPALWLRGVPSISTGPRSKWAVHHSGPSLKPKRLARVKHLTG